MAVAAVALGAWLVFDSLRNRTAVGPEDAVRVTAEAERRDLQDTIVVRGVMLYPGSGTAFSGSAGRVTAVGKEPGDTVEPGDILLELDGRPVVAVEGAPPFWRDLERGMRGSDVMALQELLADQGLLIEEPDGRFGRATEAALEEWQRSLGMSEPDGVLAVGDTVTGEWPKRVGRSVEPGSFVSAGGELLALTAAEPEVSMELVPSDRLVVEVGDPVTVEIPALGQQVGGMISSIAADAIMVDQSLLYRATVALDDATAIPEGTQLRIAIVVDAAEDVVAVPVVAVVSDLEGRPAVRVIDDDRVTTVPVELGMAAGAWVEVTSGLDGGETVLVSEATTDR